MIKFIMIDIGKFLDFIDLQLIENYVKKYVHISKLQIHHV